MMPVVLTVNPGSGSLRADLVDPENQNVLDGMHVEHPADSVEAEAELDRLLGRIDGGVDDRRRPDAVAHRLVHGGPRLRRPTVVDDGVLDEVSRAAEYAPLHVPHTLALLNRLRDRLPDVPHVVCPDTAFHAGLPEPARVYPLPARWRERWGLIRYGFHGLSYGWAVRRAAELLGRPVGELRLVLAHLGGGCSVCAVHCGRSVDTSMGFTPLEGVPMTTRSGSVDPGMLLWLVRHAGLGVDELAEGLERRSGLLGLSGGLTGNRADDGPVSRPDAAVPVLVVRPREELQMASETVTALDESGDGAGDRAIVAGRRAR